MAVTFSCPRCGEKTFSILQKSKLMRRGTKACESCGAECEIPSLLKLFVSILMAFLMPTLFIVFFGVNGFIFSLALTSLSILVIYFGLIYISPLRTSEGK